MQARRRRLVPNTTARAADASGSAGATETGQVARRATCCPAVADICNLAPYCCERPPVDHSVHTETSEMYATFARNYSHRGRRRRRRNTPTVPSAATVPGRTPRTYAQITRKTPQMSLSGMTVLGHAPRQNRKIQREKDSREQCVCVCV